MNISPAKNPKTFSLLSIGQRGVGKTVFLAGSYAELHADTLVNNPHNFWFDCQDIDVQANMEKIINHVANTNLYPPATIKITSFNFSLKRHSLWGMKTLCNFRWWDIPGESCDIRNPDFQEMILASHGCCVFINAHALLHDTKYSQTLEDIFHQVVAIASLTSQHRLKYVFAIILTKCDLLEQGTVTKLKIEQSLQPLVSRLDAVKANYQKFYSAIPIVSMEGVAALRARGAAEPLLWLLAELNKHHHFLAQQNLANGLNQSLFIGQVISPQMRRYILILSLASVSLLGVISSILFAFGVFTFPSEQLPLKEQPQSQIQPSQTTR
ncbi:hypothetical protein A6770_32470 [Nostoc minutum NIES-26]|uniref:Uncharacterized protein n=1 Tax=Nostoc minutum NIES-26 TaxID=1844469 RepID=A0A367Q6L8_9NOSO|nr:hypothetical protein A6770_32470 [Nostoc minutum NIES-26]